MECLCDVHIMNKPPGLDDAFLSNVHIVIYSVYQL